MSLSLLGSEQRKDHTLIDRNQKFIITALPNANIIMFDQNSAKIIQDYKETGDRGVEIIIDYDGSILSEKMSMSGDPWIDLDYDNESFDLFDGDIVNTNVRMVKLIEVSDDNLIDLTIGYQDYDIEWISVMRMKLNWYCYWKNYKLSFYDSRLYIISDASTNKIMNILYAPFTDLQMGDSGTYLYLFNNKHLIVYNAGDVSSVIIIQEIL